MGLDIFPSNEEMREQIDVLETKRLSARIAVLHAEVNNLIVQMRTGKLDVPTADEQTRERLEEARRLQTQLAKIHAKYQHGQERQDPGN